jgi:hypothetical protein
MVKRSADFQRNSYGLRAKRVSNFQRWPSASAALFRNRSTPASMKPYPNRWFPQNVGQQFQ